jgi:hypothetical protein
VTGSEQERPNSEDVASSLIEALAGEGEHVDEGAFTLDPAKARQKLREYQLAEPLGYVLLLVEAAHVGDARHASGPRIDFQLGSTTRASFPGVILSDEQLCNPFSAVFRGGKEGPSRVLQLLGLAANAALAAGAERIELHNVGADEHLRCVTIERDGEARIEVRESTGARVPGHTVFRYVGGALQIGRAAKELALLQAHCELASIPITVDGERIDAGQKAAFAGYRRVQTSSISVDELGIVGTAARIGAEPAKALILTRGVLAETLELERCRPGFVAVVDVDLRKDLSQRRVLRDEQFEAVLAAIVRADERLPWSTDASKRPERDDQAWIGPVVILVIASFSILIVLLAMLR